MIKVALWLLELVEPGVDPEPMLFEWAAMERDVACLDLEFRALDVARKIRGLD